MKEISEEKNKRSCRHLTLEQEAAGELLGDGVRGGVTLPAPPSSTAVL
jgi:hypothetical protein